jgi:methionyl-tRNA synthetase
MNKKSIYITTPIFYPNGKPHLGHLHTCFLASFFATAFKNFNYEVFFLTGVDEHGQKIANTAKSLNKTPQELVNENAQVFKDFMKDFSINYDYFIRTTDENHKENVLNIWRKLEKSGYLYRGVYKGLYAEKDECFYSIEDTSIKNGERVANSSGNKVEEMEEECYFFKLSALKNRLLDFYKENNEFVIPTPLLNELIGFVNNLKDLCVSRKIKWGIAIPHTNDTIYVWIDALSNYITAIGGVDNYNELFWNNSLHIIGKDIIIFHGVYWPAILMALEIPPPKNLLVHGWWLCGEEKMSKSWGNIIDPYSIKEKEYLRYFCLKQELIGHDGNFQMSHMISVINNELIGKFLNLVYRVFSLVKNNIGFNKDIILENFSFRKDIKLLYDSCEEALVKFSSKAYINVLIEYSNICNQYVDQYTIWKDFNIEHLNYLLPIIHQLVNLSKGVLVETHSQITSCYTMHETTSGSYIFILKDLKTFFKKI